ncbi:MAG: hypothetical protein ACYC3S_07790 [Chloroflexota bacterium]
MSVAVSNRQVTVEESPRWARLCAWACLSVKSAPQGSVEAVTVTVGLDGSEPADVWALAREIAFHHGLYASAIVHGNSLTLRFTQREQN